jgi:Bacterial conjugation TrbI-like protein
MDIQNHLQGHEAAPSLQELANIMKLDFDENDLVGTQQHKEDADFLDPDIKQCHTTIPTDEDEAFFDNEFNPEKNRTLVSLQNSGFAKAAVVIGGSFAVISGGAMLFQSQLPRTQVAQEVKPTQSKDTAIATAQAETAKAQQSESETKAQLALAKQKDSLTQTSDTSATPTGKSTAIKTTSLSPIADASKSRAIQVSSSARPITVVPPASNTVAQSPFRPIKQAAVSPLDKSFAITPIPTMPKEQTRRQTLVAINTPVTTQVKPTQPSKPTVSKDKATTMPIANRHGVSTATPRHTPIEEHHTLAANSSASPNNNPFSNPIRRNANSLESAKPTTGTRSLQDYLRTVASNVATPGVSSSETPRQTTDQSQLQEVTIPGMGNIARNAPIANRQNNVSDKILQQIAWSLPKNSPSINLNDSPRDLPTVAQAQGTPSLAQGIQLVQSMATANPASAQPEPESRSSANGARPSFYNSQLISGKSVEQKQEEVKTERIASNNNSPMENSATSFLTAKSILVGTSAKGSTVTPILWNAGINSTAKFILKLEEPIRDNTSQSAIPAGTQLVVMVKPASANLGFAELEVVSVIIQGREFAPPAGMFAVRDDQNGLLIGEDYFKRNDQIASRDSLNILTGALGRVGQVLNQPSSTIASVGIGSTTTVTNREPNIFGAVLEGGFRDLPATWSQRNQQALQEIANKPNVYTIPQGRSVRIFVNQTMEF